jgi:hypothetical protein
MVIVIKMWKFCQVVNSVSSDDEISNNSDEEQGASTKFSTYWQTVNLWDIKPLEWNVVSCWLHLNLTNY